MNFVYQQLPKQLADLVSEYNPEHRAWMAPVLDEIRRVACENDDCHGPGNSREVVSASILGGTYHFCCPACASYGEWSLRYDYRKAMRRNRGV